MSAPDSKPRLDDVVELRDRLFTGITRPLEALTTPAGAGRRCRRIGLAGRQHFRPSQRPQRIPQGVGDFFQPCSVAFQQDAKTGIEEIVAVGLDSGIFVHFPARTANTGDGMVVFQSPNEQALVPAIAPGQRRHGDAQLGEALQLSRFVGSVFVDPQCGGDETEHTAARWMQRVVRRSNRDE